MSYRNRSSEKQMKWDKERIVEYAAVAGFALVGALGVVFLSICFTKGFIFFIEMLYISNSLK